MPTQRCDWVSRVVIFLDLRQGRRWEPAAAESNYIKAVNLLPPGHRICECDAVGQGPKVRPGEHFGGRSELFSSPLPQGVVQEVGDSGPRPCAMSARVHYAYFR